MERSPIYSAKHRSLKIGYIEGGKAFDLSGNKCCNYNPKTGNLLEFDSGKVIGHVSLASFFVGSSWIADELFLQFDSNASPSTPASKIAAGGLTESLLSSDAERALDSVWTVPAEKSPETAPQTSGVFLNGAESFLRADATTASTTSFNKASAAESREIRLSGDAECSPKTVGVKLSIKSVEPRRQTAMTWPHECASTWRSYANRAREHGSVPLGKVVAGLSRPVRPFLTLCMLKKKTVRIQGGRISLSADRINAVGQLTPGRKPN